MLKVMLIINVILWDRWRVLPVLTVFRPAPPGPVQLRNVEALSLLSAVARRASGRGGMYPHVVHAALGLPKIHISGWSSLRRVLPVGVVGIISWSVWLVRFTLSRVYRPLPPGFTRTTSVVLVANATRRGLRECRMGAGALADWRGTLCTRETPRSAEARDRVAMRSPFR